MDRARARVANLGLQLGGCSGCDRAPADIEDIEDLYDPDLEADLRRLKRILARRQEGRGLPGATFHDPAVFRAELEHIFHRRWLMAGTVAEVPDPGCWLSVQAGRYPVLVMRGADGAVRAWHNVCRHRGYVLCEGERGRVDRHVRCAYHAFRYDATDGRLVRGHAGAACDGEFDADQHGLAPVACHVAAGYVFVSVAADPEPFDDRLLVEYAAPFELEGARVAHQSRIVESGNWKQVWSNNLGNRHPTRPALTRSTECRHCPGNHPELGRSFPADWVQTGAADYPPAADALGLPSRYKTNADGRAMRVGLVGRARSMTPDGRPIGPRRLGRMPDDADVGDVLYCCWPSTWNHWQADHAVTFRVVPLSPTETEVTTTWLVPAGADEPRDYCFSHLTAVWLATNAQDKELVERTQRGVESPAYQPGQYSRDDEAGVLGFDDWYCRQF